MITLYKQVTPIHLGLSIASGAFSIYVFFRFDPEAAKECLLDSSMVFMTQICESGWTTVKVVSLAFFIALWLAEACE